METDRTHPGQFRGVTFWPRPAARATPVDRDVHCENCGYNLRGLPVGARVCPECGAPFDPKLLASRAAESLKSRLPWKHRKPLGFLSAYWGTVRMVILEPQRFALEVWEGGRLPRRDANAFRWITIAHAYVPLLIVLLYGLGPRVPPRAFLPAAAVVAALLLLWLHKSTRLIVTFFEKQTLSADVQNRVISLAMLTCAPLALSPIHVALLALAGIARQLETTRSAGPPGMLFSAIAIAWAIFALAQLLLWWWCSLRLVRTAMQCNDAEILAVALVFIGLWLLQAGFYLLAIPGILGAIADEVFNLF